jgi:glycosyltransferase involved in cell wall biosynthesis
MKSITWFEIYVKIIIRGWRFNPKIIHCHDWYMLPAATLLKIVCRAKLIYDAHELESECQGMTRLLKIIAKNTELILWPRIDFFITVSKSIESWYLTKYGDKKSQIVFNSPQISFEVENQDIYDLRKIFPIPASSKIYLYCGSLTSGRGIEIILESFLSVESKSVLVFLGEGPLTEKINELSKKHFNIFYHPRVPHSNVVSVAKSADFGLCLIENVSLSDYFCLPNKLFEYAFARLPIIASNLPEIEKFITKYSLGKCISNNVSDLTSVIEINDYEQIKFNKPLSNDLIEFGWDKQKQKLIDINATLFASDL